MRKICLLFIYCICSVILHAEKPWGHNEETGTGTMERILRGETITYFIDSGRKGKPEQAGHRSILDTSVLKDDITNENAVREGLNMWFSYVLSSIERAGRQKEFADIIPVLQKGVSLRKARFASQADLVVHFLPLEKIHKECGIRSNGCYGKGVIFAPYLSYRYAKEGERFDSSRTLVHELGHFLGLEDQYGSARYIDLNYGTPKRIGANLSIMDSLNTLGCDDVDGLINVIDLAYANSHKNFSARASGYWKSFCQDDPILYHEGNPVVKPDAIVGQCVYSFRKNGHVNKKVCIEPFMFQHKKIRYPTLQGRLIASVTDERNGTRMSYAEFFDDADPNLYIMLHSDRTFLMDFEAFRFDDDLGAGWRIPYRNNQMDVILDEGGCYMIATYGTGIMQAEGLALNWDGVVSFLHVTMENESTENKKSEQEVLFAGKPIKFYVDGELSLKTHGWSCKIRLDGTKNVLEYDGQGLVHAKQNVLRRIAERYNTTPEELTAAGEQMCDMKEILSKIDLDDRKQLCQFMGNVERRYQYTRKQASKKIAP